MLHAGLLVGTEAPAVTPYTVDILFLFFCCT